MNYMKQVAKMLGVKPGERFNIQTNSDGAMLDCIYHFTDTNLMYEYDIENSVVNEVNAMILVNLLKGKWQIAKKPWKPKDGDWYVYDGDWYVYLEVGEELAANRIFLTRIVSRIVSPILHCWHSATVLRHRTKRKHTRTKSSRKCRRC